MNKLMMKNFGLDPDTNYNFLKLSFIYNKDKKIRGVSENVKHLIDEWESGPPRARIEPPSGILHVVLPVRYKPGKNLSDSYKKVLEMASEAQQIDFVDFEDYASPFYPTGAKNVKTLIDLFNLWSTDIVTGE